jgi:ArsR family transcriptional regulator, virulence genes transcriptional regulator
LYLYRVICHAGDKPAGYVKKMIPKNLIMIKTMKISDLNVEQLDRAANMLKAIAHPMRIAILGFLEGDKKLTVTQIHELLQIEQSTTSHHLGILKDKGVLSSKREGKNTYYFLKHQNLTQIVDCLTRCCS